MIYELKNIHAKIDGNYSDLNNKYMQLASHLKALESQVASMPSSSKQPMESLPGKPEKNPKESCNVVFSTTSPEIELSDHEKEEDEIERLVFGTEKEPNFQYQNNNQQRPYYNNQQGGYQAKQNYPQANQSPQTQGSSSQAQSPDSSVDSMFKQLLEFQARNEKTMIYEFKNIHAKIDGNYSDLNNKYMQLASHLKALESQVASMPSSSKQPMGSLPGKPEKNPKEGAGATLASRGAGATYWSEVIHPLWTSEV
ncbi:hypothetical protein DY000_02039945 [Brassica cretica]|uniref:Uncharacterized protein n=1 Tax=Brassica cretica TaxID=69181 RepID=A0ABQ7BM51_BRACR|nr:hypothetical protein DY000_02039945 [Brassica cretica]